MKYLASLENKKRGSLGFPFEYHYLDQTHPRYEMPFHWHNEYELIYVSEGVFVLSVNEHTYHLKAGDSAIIVGGAIHGGHAQKTVYECVVFDYIHILQRSYIEFSKTIELFENIEEQVIVIAQNAKEQQVVKEVFALFRQKDYPDSSKLQIVGNLFNLMGIVLSKTVQKNPSALQNSKNINRMKEVLSYIKQNYNENITLETLAQKAGLNAKYLCSLFRQLTGKTPIDYLIYYRIECACEQLVFTENSITDIAFSCGFNDISYFIKKFNRLKNTTPLKYRETYKE